MKKPFLLLMLSLLLGLSVCLKSYALDAPLDDENFAIATAFVDADPVNAEALNRLAQTLDYESSADLVEAITGPDAERKLQAFSQDLDQIKAQHPNEFTKLTKRLQVATDAATAGSALGPNDVDLSSIQAQISVLKQAASLKTVLRQAKEAETEVDALDNSLNLSQGEAAPGVLDASENQAVQEIDRLNHKLTTESADITFDPISTDSETAIAASKVSLIDNLMNMLKSKLAQFKSMLANTFGLTESKIAFQNVESVKLRFQNATVVYTFKDGEVKQSIFKINSDGGYDQPITMTVNYPEFQAEMQKTSGVINYANGSQVDFLSGNKAQFGDANQSVTLNRLRSGYGSQWAREYLMQQEPLSAYELPPDMPAETSTAVTTYFQDVNTEPLTVDDLPPALRDALLKPIALNDYITNEGALDLAMEGSTVRAIEFKYNGKSVKVEFKDGLLSKVVENNPYGESYIGTSTESDLRFLRKMTNDQSLVEVTSPEDIVKAILTNLPANEGSASITLVPTTGTSTKVVTATGWRTIQEPGVSPSGGLQIYNGYFGDDASNGNNSLNNQPYDWS